ncbi:MAG: metal-dependent transcriptional regulator, partial [Nitrososphaerota archaeon]
RFLTDILMMDWSQVHEPACRLEHALTDVASRLERALGSPKTCPHGSPIPSEEGEIKEENSTSLSNLGLGEEGILVKVSDEDPKLLDYLSSIGLFLGVKLKVIRKSTIDELVTVKVGKNSHTISGKTASLLWVKKEG